jgi:hypothetical protein
MNGLNAQEMHEWTKCSGDERSEISDDVRTFDPGYHYWHRKQPRYESYETDDTQRQVEPEKQQRATLDELWNRFLDRL